MAAPKNPVGPKSDKIWRDAIMRAVRRVATDGQTQRLEKLADKIVAKGMEGDVAAMREIGDRLDGKAHQSVNVEGDMGLTVQIVRLSDVDRYQGSAPQSATLDKSS